MTPTLADITKGILEAYNRRTRKRLGQHFLIDPKVLERIIKAGKLGPDDLVIEIGSPPRPAPRRKDPPPPHLA